MRIFLAGATGALGRPLVTQLVHAGHTVVGMTRSHGKKALLRELGAEPVVVDALDSAAVGEALARARPEIVVHQLTALTHLDNIKKYEEQFAETNRLRTEGTDNLLAAARGAGVERVIAQSFAGWAYAPAGGPPMTEDDEFEPAWPRAFQPTIDAIRYLERAVVGAGGIVLRYGLFYGPGTAISADGGYGLAVRARQFPLVGDARGVWSFVHVDDAAAATVAAIDRGRSGIYNVVDDEPARVGEWLPLFAKAVGAPPPRRVPTWLARFFIGPHGVAMITAARGASNAKAKRELGWAPRYASWRDGLQAIAAKSDGADAAQAAPAAAA